MKAASLLVIVKSESGVSGSETIPVKSILVAISQGTGLTWFGVMDGGAFMRSNTPVAIDHPDVCPRASTALERMSYRPAGISNVGRTEYSLPSFAEPR